MRKPDLTIKKADFNGKEVIIEREMFNIIDEGKEPSKYFDVPVYHPLTQRPMLLVKTSELIRRLGDMKLIVFFWEASEFNLIERELIARN